MSDLQKIIPGLWQIQNEIDSAYSGMRFCWNDPKCHEIQEQKHKVWSEKKKQLLKPIFGA